MPFPAFGAATAASSAGKGVSLASIANVATIAGAAIGAIGLVSSGMAAKRQGEFQATVLQQQADRERLDAAEREKDFRRQQSRLMATRRAVLGGTGIEPTEGSPLLVSEDMAGEAELQALRLRSGGETVATRLEQQAILSRAQGTSAQQSGFLRGGSLLLSGAGSAFRRKAMPLTV